MPPGRLLLLAEALLLLLGQRSLLLSDGREERLEVDVEMLRVDPKIPVQEE